MDFTLNTYDQFLQSLYNQGFSFQTFAGFISQPRSKVVILRHDVDRLPMNSLITAQIENSMDIAGTYYFRTVPESFNEYVISRIAHLGHEIGYHYENLAASKGNYEAAIKDFKKNLERFHELAQVKTICMHGSPLSKWDNSLLWDKYNYRDYGIAGEPYFDIDFSQVLYLTDTGRRWDGKKVSVRDRAYVKTSARERSKFQDSICFHSTFDIIKAANEGRLPDKLLITIHPQRWTDKPFPWLKELVWQNVKNVVKRVVVMGR